MTAVEDAFKKGKAAGRAAAARKAKEAGAATPTRRRRKTYRMKKPTVAVKQGIGRWQHKHPYLNAIASGIVLTGAVDGAVQVGTGQALTRHMGLGGKVDRVPGVKPIREATAGLGGALRRWLNL